MSKANIEFKTVVGEYQPRKENKNGQQITRPKTILFLQKR
jgi:hypothetical protein